MDEIRFLNSKEDLKNFEYNENFFVGLQAIADEFQEKVKTYGDKFNIELNGLIYFKLIKGEK